MSNIIQNNLIYGRFDILRFPLILLVIYLHNSATEVHFSGGTVSIEANKTFLYINNFISNGIARVAVPLFYLIAGFLFYFKDAPFRQKLKSRAYSLLVPYLFWNTILFAFICAARCVPILADFFASNCQQSVFSLHTANVILGFTQVPINYQFWFIRDLMILVILAPAIRFLLLRASSFTIGFLCVLWGSAYQPLLFTSYDSALFFSIGAALAIHQISPFILDSFGPQLCATALISFTGSIVAPNFPAARLLQCLGIASGTIAALYLSGIVAKFHIVAKFLLSISTATFFLFAIHEPLLTIARKLILKWHTANSWTVNIAFFILPPVVAVIGILTYRFSVLVAPRFVLLITGGRRP